jgi:hypothetical protein
MSPALAIALTHQRKYLEPTAADLDLPADDAKLYSLQAAEYGTSQAAWRRYWADQGAAGREAEERSRRRHTRNTGRARKRLGKAVE